MGAPDKIAAEHTMGTARVGDEDERTVVYVGNRQIGECYEDGEEQTAEDAANARRIAACWNSCHRIPTELLEELGPVVVEGAVPHHQLTDRLAKVRAALEEAIDGGEECRGRDAMISGLIRICDGEAY